VGLYWTECDVFSELRGCEFSKSFFRSAQQDERNSSPELALLPQFLELL